MKIVLASQSPRRSELLAQLGLSFEVCPATGQERLNEEKDTGENARILALSKAKEVAQKYGGECLVIAADTLVCLEGEVFGKPRDEKDAKRMLKKLSGKTHEVWSGVAIFLGNKSVSDSVCTKVSFRALAEGEILTYIATGEPLDKAGAYGIQGKGALFVKGIEGDYFNVVGLPLCRLAQMIKESFGIELIK